MLSSYIHCYSRAGRKNGQSMQLALDILQPQPEQGTKCPPWSWGTPPLPFGEGSKQMSSHWSEQDTAACLPKSLADVPSDPGAEKTGSPGDRWVFPAALGSSDFGWAGGFCNCWKAERVLVFAQEARSSSSNWHVIFGGETVGLVGSGGKQFLDKPLWSLPEACESELGSGFPAHWTDGYHFGKPKSMTRQLSLGTCQSRHLVIGVQVNMHGSLCASPAK